MTLSHPVENYMYITIGRIGNVPTGATVDPETIRFWDGDYEQTFILKISENNVGIDGNLVFYRDGVD